MSDDNLGNFFDADNFDDDDENDEDADVETDFDPIVGVAVVDAFLTGRPGDHREHHDPEAIDEPGLQ